MLNTPPEVQVVSKGTLIRWSTAIALGQSFRSWHDNHSAIVRGTISVVAAAVLWELVGRFVITSTLFFVPLSRVGSAFFELWANGDLQRHISTSLAEFLLGYVPGGIVGILLGFVFAINRTVREFIDPWANALYSTPIYALAPLFILWFGIGIESKAVIIFLVVLFPVLFNTQIGITTTSPELLEAARSFCASTIQIFTKVMLPSALPVIVAGLRLGLARGVVGVVVAELFGSRAGLGYLILVSGQVFDTANLFVGVLLLSASGVLGVEALKRLERHLAPWRASEVR